MKRKAIIATGIAIIISCLLVVLAWSSPWITKDYALDRVVEHLGGNEEARFMYLGEEMAVGDVPKAVAWYPFARAVYFPGEACGL